MNQLGKYKLETEIGRGPSGVVYRGFDSAHGRSVAIKILHRDANFNSRFNRQAQQLVQLTHKNIVTTFEYVEESESPYLVMEYVGGPSLAAHPAASQPMSLFEKTSIMTQVAEGLLYAHEKGIVHGDINPSNIKVLPDGTVKILSFAGRAANEVNGESFLGSLAYLAPEALEAKDIDNLCDIFSFGVVYYELVTGKNPFVVPGNEIAPLIYNILCFNPPLANSIESNCPGDLANLIARSLEKDRAQRYQSFEDLLRGHAPIHLTLQAAEADVLIRSAQTLRDERQLSEAKKQVLQALTFDPRSVSGRQLLESLNREILQKAQRERAAQLLEGGQRRLSLGEYAPAVEAFEKVLELDPENREASGLLEQARAELAKRQRRAALLDQARKELQSGRIADAYNHTLECLQDFPGDAEATNLLDKIQTERERQIRREAALKVIAELQNLIAQTRFEEAVILAGKAARDFPEESEILNLATAAEQSLLKHQRTSQIKDITANANRMVEQKDFEGAVNLLRISLAKFGPDPSLENLRQSVEKTLKDQRDAAAKQATLSRVRQLIRSDSLQEAIALLEAALERYPADESMSLLLVEARQLLAAQQKREKTERVLFDARNALNRGDVAAAERLTKARIIEDPDDVRLTELLGEIQSQIVEAEKTRAGQTALDRALSLELQGQLQQAAELLEIALLQDPSQANVHTKLESLRGRIEKQQEVKAAVKQINGLMARGMRTEAQERVSAAIDTFPGETSLLALKAQIEAEVGLQIKREEITKATKEANRLLSLGRMDEARTILEQGLARYPAEQDLTGLLARIHQLISERDRAQGLADLLQDCERKLREGRAKEAVGTLERSLGQFPSDARLQSLLERARNEVTGQEQNTRRATLLERAQAEAEKQSFQKAIKILERGLKDLPNDQQLIDALDRIRGDASKHAALQQERKPKAAYQRYAIIAVLLVVALAGAFYWRSSGDRETTSKTPSPNPIPIAPKILRFSADPETVAAGSKTRICYGAENADSLAIQPGVGMVEPSKDKCIELEPDETREYQLTVMGTDGSTISQSLTITVVNKSNPPAVPPQPPAVSPVVDNPPLPPDPARESADWTRLNRQSLVELNAFLAKYPNGAHSNEARRMAKDLEDAEKDRNKTLNTEQARKDAVLNAIRQYEAALKRKDIEEILNISPGEARITLEANFNQKREHLSFELAANEPSFKDQNSATARGTERFKPNRDESQEERRPFTITLERKSGVWKIVKITYP